MSEIRLLNIDCMEYLATCKDKQFDIAIVDSPYFSDYGKEIYPGAKISTTGIKRNRFHSKHWMIPGRRYFDELYRASTDQIIWGINYYAKYSRNVGRIVWDKKNDKSSFSQCEIAMKSFGISVDIFRFMWNGMLQENMKDKEVRVHPTQKPVALYRWILKNYVKHGQSILDTHGGSMSLAIAVHEANTVEKMDLSLVICELDKDYYDAAVKRYNNHISQQKINFPE